MIKRLLFFFYYEICAKGTIIILICKIFCIFFFDFFVFAIFVKVQNFDKDL